MEVFVQEYFDIAYCSRGGFSFEEIKKMKFKEYEIIRKQTEIASQRIRDTAGEIEEMI